MGHQEHVRDGAEVEQLAAGVNTVGNLIATLPSRGDGSNRFSKSRALPCPAAYCTEDFQTVCVVRENHGGGN